MQAAIDFFTANELKAFFNVYISLREGLTRFRGPTRLSLLLLRKSSEPMWVFDPDLLLRVHDSIMSQYIAGGAWKISTHVDKLPDTLILTEPPDLPGAVVVGASSKSCFFQMWIAESGCGDCCPEPIKEWLKFGAKLLTEHIVGNGDSASSIGSLSNLRGFGLDAIASYVSSELNTVPSSTPIVLEASSPSIHDMLEAVLGISKTREEGTLATGKLLFINQSNVLRPMPARDEVNYVIRFPKDHALPLSRFKHVRKLMTAIEGMNSLFLVADSEHILGIGREPVPSRGILATFLARHGQIALGDKLICNFADGRFIGNSIEPNFDRLKQILNLAVKENTEQLIRIVTKISTNAQTKGHGCSIVIALGDTGERLSGQQLEENLSLRTDDELEIASSMSKVDGALHIDHCGNLIAFGCLLDGIAVPSKEDRERGSRYNSAVRYTDSHADKIVVIVSEDGPVSIFQHGVPVNAPTKYPVPVYQRFINSVCHREWVSGTWGFGDVNETN